MNFFRLNAGHSRIFGLDLLRFFAIMFVVIGHSMILVPKSLDHTVASSETLAGISEKYHVKEAKILKANKKAAEDGISEGEILKIPKEHVVRKYVNGSILDGVAIFFVLSGFLIGGILIKLLEKEKPTFPVLLNFWNRRWLRTLPMYLVILIFLIISTYFMMPQKLPGDVYKYFFFLQNFATPPPAFFGESWSLSIEEWFYLTVPLLLFGGLYFFKTKVKTMFIIVIPLVIVAIMIYRFLLFNNISFHMFGFNFSVHSPVNVSSMREAHRYLMEVMSRLDSIMYGVLAAFVAFYYPKLWQKANNINLVLLGIVILYVMKIHLDVSYVVWIPAFKSIAVMIMLPYLANWKTLNWKISRFVTFISLISYSMYLVNLSVVIHFIIKYCMNGENLTDKHVAGSDWPLEYLLYWVFTIGLSFLFYKLVEVPFMEMRKKAK